MISLKDLSEEQQSAIRQWAADGAGLDEIHTRMRDEFGLRLTFMDARFLVADLEIDFEEDEEEEEVVEVVEVDVVDEATAAPVEPEPIPMPAEAGADAVAGVLPEEPALPNVTVTISDIAAPDAMASGTVDFGNGNTAVWTMDQTGRLGMNGANPEFQPSEEELMAFQVELQRVAQTRGF